MNTLDLHNKLLLNNRDYNINTNNHDYVFLS